jgi:tripartite-type tricarboxylate transporter receptor subunit TctC
VSGTCRRWTSPPRQGSRSTTCPIPTGPGPQREALLSGETDAASVNLATVFPAGQAGQARVLGVMDAERSPFLPDVPTFQEDRAMTSSGEASAWSRRRPESTRSSFRTLESAFAAVFEMEEFQQRAEETAMGAVYMNAEETAAYVAASQAKAFALIDSLVEQGILER